MSAANRAEKFQRKLREMIAFNAYMELGVEKLGQTVCCSVPLTPATSNHFGTMHAAILFAVAEATAGIAVTQHRELAHLTIIASDLTINFLRMATTAVIASTTLDPGFIDNLHEQIAANSKFAFDIPVELNDEHGALVARATCRFQMRVFSGGRGATGVPGPR